MTLRALSFAVRALVRQPGRACLGVGGIAAVGALLFDMLLLSNGLVVSFRRLLDEVGYDVRVTATDSFAGAGPRIRNVTDVVRTLSALPEIESVVPIRFGEADIVTKTRPINVTMIGAPASSSYRPWKLLEGGGLHRGSLLVNRQLAERLDVTMGSSVDLRGTCTSDRSALPPVRFEIAGIAEFPFDDGSAQTVAAEMEDVARVCGEEGSREADLIVIKSRSGAGPDAAIAAIRRRLPGLHPFTNAQLVARVQEAGLSYFRQISTVLATVTLLFAVLLITVLLTVSVNQRLGEIATLRAVGFSRRRIAADVLCQSALLVGTGGVLALPLGLALARGLDRILRAMPGIPATLDFFEYEPRALALHVTLLAVTAILAAAYPVRIVSRLPIAATLRNEVVT